LTVSLALGKVPDLQYCSMEDRLLLAYSGLMALVSRASLTMQLKLS